MPYKFAGMVEGGRLAPSAFRPLLNLLRGFEGKWVTITVREGRQRTSKQNRYFHGVVLPTIAAAFAEWGNTGWTEERVKKLLKEECEFLEELADPFTGEIKTVLKSTSDATAPEMVDFTTACIAWAAERDIIVPLPDESAD